MTDIKVWYTSKTVLALLAGIILAIGAKFGLLPAEMTSDKIVDFLYVVVPMLIALWSRLTAKSALVSSSAKVEDAKNTLYNK